MTTLLAIALSLVLQGTTTGTNGETWENEAVLSTGQTVTLTWTLGDNTGIDSLIILRQANTTGSTVQLVRIAPTSGEYLFVMPSGSAKAYRVRVCGSAETTGKVSPCSNEFLVTRK